jgi:hypothetical protein
MLQRGASTNSTFVTVPSHTWPDSSTLQLRGEEDGSANGIRTRVTAVRGRCPRPLDDSASELHVHWETGREERSVCYFRMVYGPEQAILFTSPTFFRPSIFPLLAQFATHLRRGNGFRPEIFPGHAFFCRFFSGQKTKFGLVCYLEIIGLTARRQHHCWRFCFLGPSPPARTVPVAGSNQAGFALFWCNR